MGPAGATYHDLIARNRRNSTLLVASFLLLIAAFVGVLSAALFDAPPQQAATTAMVALFGAGVVALWSYYGGGGAILRMSGAHPLSHGDDPVLFNVVEEMAIAAGLSPPQVYLIEDSALNAFATGRDPEHAAVAITRGLRERLGRDELQAVIAHEMSHVRHLDIRLMMLLATLVGVVVLISDGVLRMMRFNSWSAGSRRDNRSRDGGAGMALLALALLFSIVAPLVAKVIQLAASREREYLADAGAVELTRNPEAMISALRKLGEDREVLEAANRATAHLYIVQPIKTWEQRARGLLSTHPPLESRIARLQGLIGARAGSGGSNG